MEWYSWIRDKMQIIFLRKSTIFLLPNWGFTIDWTSRPAYQYRKWWKMKIINFGLSNFSCVFHVFIGHLKGRSYCERPNMASFWKALLIWESVCVGLCVQAFKIQNRHTRIHTRIRAFKILYAHEDFHFSSKFIKIHQKSWNFSKSQKHPL